MASQFLQGEGQSPCDGPQRPVGPGLSDLSSSLLMLAVLQGPGSLSLGPFSRFPLPGAVPPASHTLLLSPVSSVGFNVTLKAEVHPVHLIKYERPPPPPPAQRVFQAPRPAWLEVDAE